MEHLQVRFTDLVLLKGNEVRELEHSTLSRLMYSCRNPHRRAPYFLRLEHVRRLLRRINSHAAWSIVDSSLHKQGAKKHRRDSVSEADLEKLASLMELTELLVQKAIPKAAHRLTTELIVREQYVPLATTLVALLARVFVLERPIMLALKCAVAEARLIALPASHGQSTECANEFVHVKLSDEDLGEVITPKDEPLKRKLSAPSKKSQKRARRFFSELAEAKAKESFMVIREEGIKDNEAADKDGGSGKSDRNEAGKPEAEKEVMSLYDLMAVGDAEVAALAKTQVESSQRFVAEQEHGTKRTSSKRPRKRKPAIMARKAVEDLDAIFAGLSD